jgi:hypothetical protein
MSDQQVILELTTQEMQRLQAHAQAGGYASVEAYLRALIEADEIEADEALWDAQFARSQDVLEAMAAKAHAEYEAGLTEDFDPETYDFEDK